MSRDPAVREARKAAASARSGAGLGIDAGGTFTDAVIVDGECGDIIAQAKAPTTPFNPAEGVRDALSRLPSDALRSVGFASLATTFATNAIVQGRGGRAGLILIGYDPDHPALFAMSPKLHVAGGHDYWGNETRPLDIALLEREIGEFSRNLDAVAISGYFSVRNPAHEELAFQCVTERCGLPCVCGHRLSGRLDAVKRATTAWWNGRLIPLIRRLIDDTRSALDRFGIRAALMVVRGDGTLISAEEARFRPVETLLSGPAASIIGARHLTGLSDALVVDMGGTTTDMAMLRGGRVAIDPDGARVGEWKTHVAAARIRTTGLGGDSLIQPAAGAPGGLTIGPERVEPVCVMATRYPEIREILAKLTDGAARLSPRIYNPCTFYAPVTGVPANPNGEDESADALPDRLINEHQCLADPEMNLSRWALRRMVAENRLIRASLTPTDFRVAEGMYDLGDRETARMAVALMAAALRVSMVELRDALKTGLARRLCLAAVEHLAGKDGSAIAELAHRWFGDGEAPHAGDTVLRLDLSLSQPVIGTGAPAAAWLPESFRRLNAECRLPERYMVATAVGAAVGTVETRFSAEVRPGPPGNYTLHTPTRKSDFNDYDEAMAVGERELRVLALEWMTANRVNNPLIEVETERQATPVPGGELYRCTFIHVRATGRMDISS